MLSFRIYFDYKELEINNEKKYFSKKLKELKSKLGISKEQMDEDWKNKIFSKYWREFDPFYHDKKVIAILGNTFNVTNAWLKCYELINYFNLIPDDVKDSFLHFDNAAFPGSFILSTHHYVNTHRKWGSKYKWNASSLLNINSQNSTPLEDKYELYKNYPKKWLMDENNNGDVLIRKNQEDFIKKIGGIVDLYTSDLGFDVSSDYNNQELLQLPANIGQILSGILTLKKGGCFITKQYMTFEMTTISIMFALSQMFDEFYLCKPYTSREANSETYLVGKGFKGGFDIKHPYIEAMFDRIEGKIDIEIPLFDAKSYPKKYIPFITKITGTIFNRQIDKLEHDIKNSRKCVLSNFNDKHSNNPIVKEFINSELHKVEKWYIDNIIYPISDDNLLNMYDHLYQNIH